MLSSTHSRFITHGGSNTFLVPGYSTSLGEPDVFIAEDIVDSFATFSAATCSTIISSTSTSRATASATGDTSVTMSTLLRPQPLIKINLRFIPASSHSFTSKLNQVCDAWSPSLIEQRGICYLLQRLVNTIFEDNARLYNIFLLDASTCPTTSIQTRWGTTCVNNWENGVRFRSFIQVNERPYVIFIFNLNPLSARDLALTFTLDYMHEKFREEHIVPEIFPKPVGTLNIENEMVIFVSWTGENYFYPKKFHFLANIN